MALSKITNGGVAAVFRQVALFKCNAHNTQVRQALLLTLKQM